MVKNAIMGMYDTIKIPSKYLPEEVHEEELQTKSFDIFLNEYEITEDLILLLHDKRISNPMFLNMFSETINFYTLTKDRKWFSWSANIENGKLIKLTQKEPQEKEIIL